MRFKSKYTYPPKKKTLSCQIDSCGKEVLLRSTIREGEFKGKKVCAYCKKKYEAKKSVRVVKEKRESYSEFFDKMIELLKVQKVCENCGKPINVGYLAHHNIAHILSKQRYKSVATNQHNILFLCSAKDGAEACHDKFDSSIKDRVNMPVFALAKKRIDLIRNEIEEKGNELFIFDEK